MKELFVPYPQSLELRELGFDEICFTHYWGENILNEAYGGWMKNSNTKYVMAPTWEQTFKWFRIKYGLTSWIYNSDKDKFFYTILEDGRFVKGHNSYSTYEEAELACLIKLIEIVGKK